VYRADPDKILSNKFRIVKVLQTSWAQSKNVSADNRDANSQKAPPREIRIRSLGAHEHD